RRRDERLGPGHRRARARAARRRRSASAAGSRDRGRLARLDAPAALDRAGGRARRRAGRVGRRAGGTGSPAAALPCLPARRLHPGDRRSGCPRRLGGRGQRRPPRGRPREPSVRGSADPGAEERRGARSGREGAHGDVAAPAAQPRQEAGRPGGTERRFQCPPPLHGTVEAGAQPTFSIAIPAYQAAATIGEALESALSQTLPAADVVVCDDGSTDDLEPALAPFRDRVVLLRQENGGEGAAKATATEAATGDFVALLDADDAYLPDRLEAFAELAAARPDLDVLTTDAYLESEGRVVRRCYAEGWRFEVADQRREILRRNFVFGSAAVRRERLLAVGGFDRTLRFVADWDLWIRLILTGSRVGLVDEPLYRYRVGPTALSAQRPALVRGSVEVLERAARRADLSADERRVVGVTISSKRAELARLELDEALAGDGTDVRRRGVRALREA